MKNGIKGKRIKEKRINGKGINAMSVTLLVAILLVMTFTSGCGKKTEEVSPSENIVSESYYGIDSEKVSEVLSGMSLEQRIEQMIMPAFRSYIGDEEKKVTVMDDTLKAFVSSHTFGGVILFAENIDDTRQVATFTRALQEANEEGGSPTGLLIAVDQEGGRITRFDYACQMPGNMALGATISSDIPEVANFVNGEELYAYATEVTEAGALIGKELFVQGFNVDFAPVLDVNINPSNPIIGVRSFSDDPERAGQLGKAYIQGLHDEKVIATVKHFPGHGDTDTDSHTGLPSIDKSLDELKECELVPFMINAEDADVVMTAHIQFPQIEKETYKSKESGEEITLPATLSKTILTDVLRNELGFNGVITTDSLDMGAIASHFDPMDTARLAINAGVDLLLIPTSVVVEEMDADLTEYVSGIAAMVRSGEIPEERINESAGRIIALKMKYDIMPGRLPVINEDEAVSIVGSKQHHLKEWEIACKSVTIVKSDVLPPVGNDEKIAVAVPYASEMNSVPYGVLEYKEFAKERFGTEYDVQGINVICYGDIQDWDLDAFIDGADVVIGVSALYDQSELDPNTEDGVYTAFLDRLIEKTHEKGKRFVLISAQLPYDVARFPEADTIMACYNARGMAEIPEPFNQGTDSYSEEIKSYGPNIPAAIYTALGGNVPTGTLPVDIPKLNDDYTYSDEILYERGTGLTYE